MICVERKESTVYNPRQRHEVFGLQSTNDDLLTTSVGVEVHGEPPCYFA